jgi:plasmid stabilization system protein ParE
VRAVRYHPEARAEFLHDVEYYAAISTRLAELYDKAVHTAEMQAAATPEAWPEYRKKTRRGIERRSKFSLVYLHSENEIYVVAIAPMGRYKPVHRDPLLLPVILADQVHPGTFEFALDHLVDHELELSALDARFHKDESGASAYDPRVILTIVLLAYSRRLISSRTIERACTARKMIQMHPRRDDGGDESNGDGNSDAGIPVLAQPR